MKKIAGTSRIEVQLGQNCAIATQVEIISPVSEPTYGTKLIKPDAKPISKPCLRPSSDSAAA